MGINGDKLFWTVILAVIGIMVSVVASFMIISEKSGIERIYDTGQVCDIFEDIYHEPGEGMEYLAEKGVLVVKEENAYKYIDLYQMEEQWKYIVLELSGFNVEELACRLIFYDNVGAEQGTQDVSLQPGKNCIKIEGEQEYSGISFVFPQAGTEFYIEDMQFRTDKPVFSWDEFMKYAVISMAGYVLVSILGYTLWRRKRISLNWYAGIDGIQQSYCMIGNKCTGFAQKLGDRTKSRLRTGLFLFMIIYMQIIMNLGLYESGVSYKYQALVCSEIIFGVALLCREQKLEKQNWNNKLAGSWYFLWLAACISDFLVTKRYAWTGYIMIFSVGQMFFMWNNMKDRSLLIKEWMTAIRWSFVCNVLFCFLCRPEVVGTRYIGGYYNPGMFAMYLLFVWLVLLQSVDEKLKQGMKLKYYLLEIIGSGILLTLLWKTQSASGILPAAVAFFIFGVKQIAGRRNGIVKLAVTTLLLGMVVSTATSWSINHIPQALHTEIKFESDTHIAQREMPLGPVKVYAGNESITDSRIYQKLFKSPSLESFTTRRSVYWAGYLRGMNLLGNENKEYLWGKNRWPHNGFIAIAYRYGVFTVIPYTIMVITSMIYSWHYLRQKGAYGLFIFSVNICSFILILMENLELPFLFLCWFCMYLMMGILFEKPRGMQETER